MKTEGETRKALGRKSKRLALENMTKVFLTVAKEPLSFSELLQKTKLSKPVLTNHLRYLENKRAIYRDTLKEKPEEFGKVIYKPAIDAIPTILFSFLSLLDVLSDPFEDEKLNEDLEEKKKVLVDFMVNYLKEYDQKRPLYLKKQLEKLGGRKVED